MAIAAVNAVGSRGAVKGIRSSQPIPCKQRWGSWLRLRVCGPRDLNRRPYNI
jgi:hypothetical protein